MLAAFGAQAGGAPGLVALAAPFASDAALGLHLPAAIELPFGLGLGVARSLTRPARLAARSAHRTPGIGRCLPAAHAQSGGAALLGLPARVLALIELGPLRVPSRHPGRPEPCVAGAAGSVALGSTRPAHGPVRRERPLPALRAQALGGTLGGAPVMACAVGGPPLLGARLALAAMRRGRALPAFEAKALRAALGGSAVVALQVSGAPGLDVLLGHRGVLPAEVGVRARDARPARCCAVPAGRPGRRPLSPAACGRIGAPRPRCPRAVGRRGCAGPCR